MSDALATECDFVNDNARAVVLAPDALMERGRLSGGEVAATVNTELPDSPPSRFEIGPCRRLGS
jgi:hypothetical protein